MIEIRKLRRSIKHALRGVKIGFKTEQSFRIQSIFSLFVADVTVTEIYGFSEHSIFMQPKFFFLSIIFSLIGQIGDEDSLGTKEHKYLATIACHSSVKAGDNLVNKEMIEIIEKLRITTSPFSCPHGRPTILNFTYNKLEKDFRRINS